MFTFTRVRYVSGRSGYGRRGGGWATDLPDSDLNLSYRLQQMTSLKCSPDGRILELAPNRPIWAFDETIHAAEAGTTQLFRDGLGRQDALLSPPSELAGIRISPTKIVGYIARVIVKTLPPRPVGKFSP